MQKVFLILLISLSTCLSKPSEPTTAQDAAKLAPVQASKPEVPVSPTAITNFENKIADPSTKPSANDQQKANVTDVTTVHENATVPTNQTTEGVVTKTEGDNKTTDKKEEAAPKTDAKKEESHNTTVIPAAKEQTPKSEETPTPQETKPKVEPVPPKNDVSPKQNATTTVAPKTDGEKPVVLQSRGFDGPSFIGGIILTLGLLAIGFMGFKYYRNQTERNYHTL